MTDRIAQATSEERLRDILHSVNDWLRYAEAKNGAIVVSSLALVVGGLQVLQSYSDIPPLLRAYLILVLAQLLLASCISLVSFLPRTNIGRLLPKGDKAESDNLLFFAHIAKYSPKYFLESVRELEGLDTDSATGLECSFSEQAVVNARIALWKFHCSTWAIRAFLSALVTPPLVMVIERQLEKERT